MSLNLQKSVHIASDLLSYCQRKGGTDFNIDIRLRPYAAVFEIRCPLEGVDETELSRLSNILNVPRQHEVEQNFWGLAGEAEEDSELVLTGMMTDEADISYEDGVLRILVRRLTN